MNELKDTPALNWTLDQLGNFCVQCGRKMAIDAWGTGKAMCIAKDKCQDDQKSFTAWKQKFGFSDATTSRYMRLFLAFPTEEDRERLADIGIMEALIQAGVSKPKPKKANTSTAPQGVDDSASEFSEDAPRDRIAINTVPALKSTTAKPPWAANDNEDGVEELLDDTDLMASIWSRGETLEEECRKTFVEGGSKRRRGIVVGAVEIGGAHACSSAK